MKGTRFLFRLGTMKRTEEIGQKEGYAEAWRGATGKQPTPLTFPNH